MQVRRINGMFSIANQVDVRSIKSLAEAGYKTLICNRPDDESDDFDTFDTIAQVARSLGLTPVYLPVALSGATSETQDAFDELIMECPKPIVAYCRSGTRSATLWTSFDVKHNGGHSDGPERRVDAMQRGALSVRHYAKMAYGASFNPRRSGAAHFKIGGLHRKSA